MIELSLVTLGYEEALQYFERAPKRVRASLRAGLRESGRILRAAVSVEAPIASGNLVRSFRIVQSGELSFDVGPTVEYSKFVEGGRSPGSRPPPLSSARFRQWLERAGIPRSEWYAVARSIGREGISPDDFMTRAFSRVDVKMVEAVAKRVEAALGR